MKFEILDIFRFEYDFLNANAKKVPTISILVTIMYTYILLNFFWSGLVTIFHEARQLSVNMHC